MSLETKVKAVNKRIDNELREVKNTKRSIRDLHSKIADLAKNASGSLGDCKGCTQYLSSVMDPEANPPHRYPDQFCERTSIFRAMNNIDITPRAFTAEDLSDGEFRLMVFPEISNTIYELQSSISTCYAHFYENSELEGWIPRPGVADNDTTNDGDAILLQDRFLELRLTENNPGGELITSAPGESTNGQNHEFWPKVPNPNVSTLTVVCKPYQAPGTGGGTGTLLLTQRDEDDNILVQHSVPYTVATTDITLTIAVQTTSDRYAASYFEIGNSGSRYFHVAETTAWIESGYVWKPHELPDLVLLKEHVEKYRVVAQSALLTYMSEVLTAAGQVSGLLYRGGEFPFTAGVSSYSEIARHKDSYNGMLLEGNYTFWEPMDEQDMVFRPVYTQLSGRSPMIVIAGVYSGATIPENCLRLRVVTVVEFTSKSQMFESEPSPVEPRWIEMANSVLSTTPNSMENGKHKARLRRYLSKLPGFVQKFSNYLWQNREPLLREAEKLALTLA